MKTITLSFKNGMTNNPADIVAADDSLAAEYGALYDGTAHKPIQHPHVISDDFAEEVIIIHDFANYTHVLSIDGQDLSWCDINTPATRHAITQVTAEITAAQAIGNTVVLNTTDGLLYLLWKNDTQGYKVLGNQLPEIQIAYNNITRRQDHFNPDGADVSKSSDYFMRINEYVEMNSETIPGDLGHYPTITRFTDEAQFKNIAIGLIEKCIKKAHRENLYLFPYWVRAAYRLYDGSHAMITNPVLMLPTVRYNRRLILYAIGGLEYEPFAGELCVRIMNDISEWTDIIQGIDIFTSDEVRTFDIEGTYQTHPMNESADYVIADFTTPGTNPMAPTAPPQYTKHIQQYTSTVEPEQKSDEQIINQLINNAVFYKIAQLDPEDFGTWLNLSEKIGKDTVTNLRTQTQLEHDDFYGHTKMIADVMLAYNGRLHLANIERGFFSGFRHFISMQPSARTIDYWVEIQANNGLRTIHGQTASDAIAYWFYYPDPRAKKLTFILNNNKYTLALKQHPLLNGAYYFGALPTANDDNLPTPEADSTTPQEDTTPEPLPNQIITSEANNPFLYNADGANDVGSGRILAITTNTHALSEGQFGQHPLIAFTTEGIWALTTNTEGLYNNVIPLSREVCSNPKTVTQTDSAIYFASQRGLMQLQGAAVRCVSELLNGKLATLTPFHDNMTHDTLKNTLNKGAMAYDYKNRLLWIYNQNIIFVHNINTGAFARYLTSDIWKNDFILYPDSIIQTANGKLLSLMKTPDINDDIEYYDMTLISRPVKMRDPLSYKTIFRLQHLWQSEGNLSLKLYGSDDLREWQTLDSLHGKPWKFYTLRIDLTHCKATDTYHGISIEFQPRHTNRQHAETDTQASEYTPL